jgi:WD40 repeat protein/tRNA A-37 threonylcarbamoyl transferase component Bud32
MLPSDHDANVALIQAARAALGGAGRPHALRDSAVTPMEIDGYELIREVGRGGQGIVYQALQRSTQRYVAIKVLRHGMLATAGEQARLEREVCILAQLRHPGIVAIHDSGCSGNLSYVVMDYIDGVPFDAYVAGAGLSTREKIELFVRIADAVNAAHLRGVIHRDLKPANVRVDADGQPHVLDFGVAKLVEPESPLATLTMTGQFVGSLQWAAPEQARGDQAAVDVRTDVYALGVIFWHALTGSFPYPVDGDASRMLANILTAAPTFAGCKRAFLPLDVETTVRKCLAKEPERRYQNAGELAADLRCYLEGKPIAARRDSQWYVLRKTIARHRAVSGLAAAIFLLATGSAIGLGILYLQAGRSAALANERAEHLREALYYNSISLAEKAYESGNPIELNAALDQCPAAMRHWEYWHLKRLTDESVLSWKAHERNITVAAFSPDGRYLLTSGLNARLSPPIQRETKLWDAATGALIRIIDSNNALNGTACWSPDGARIAVGGRHFRYRMYDAETGNLLYEVDRGTHTSQHNTALIAFADGSNKVVIGDGYNHGVSVHDAETGAVVLELSQPHPVSMDASPDGRHVAIGSSDRLARLWSIESGACVVTMAGHLDQVRGVAFAPDGTHLITAAWDGRLCAWELPGGALRSTTEAQPREGRLIQSLDYAPDGRHVAFSSSLWVELWDARSSQRLRRLLGHTASAGPLCFSPDSQRVACATYDDGVVRIWDLRGGRARRELDARPGRGAAAAWSSDGRWIAAYGERLVLLDGVTETTVWEHNVGTGHEWALDVAFSPDSRLLAHSGAGTDIEFRDVTTGKLVSTIWAHNGRAGRLAWSRDGRFLASLGTDQFLRVWNPSDGKLVREILVGTSEIVMGTDFAVAFSPDGSLVAASARDNVVRVWEVVTGRVTLELAGHEDSVGGLCFTSDGRRIITGSLDRTIRVWDARSGACERTLRGPLGALRQLALMTDDRHVFCTGSDTRLWDIETGRRVLTLGQSDAKRIAISPDGTRLVAVRESGPLAIWDGSPLSE